MTTAYHNHLSRRNQTPQSEKTTKGQKKNSAGGYSFKLDDWKRLERFLILGSDGGTYYVSEQKLTRHNAKVVDRCLEADPQRTIQLIRDISVAGRAPKNDPAIFALAITATHKEPAVRAEAYKVLEEVCRIGTHLFHFVAFHDSLLGSNTRFRKALGRWYNNKPVDRLAYQLVKYQQRDGWSHRDVLRLAHPKPIDADHAALYHYAVGKDWELPEESQIVGFEYAKTATRADLLKYIKNYKLTWEMVPTEQLKDPRVWDALLPNTPLHATVRNLGRLTSIGLLTPQSAATKLVLDRLEDKDYISKSRMHPLAVLVALKVYKQGHGMKGNLSWNPLSSIVDALDEAFYLSFGNVEPTGKRNLLALDVSGSMGFDDIAGMPITPREASAAMAMVTARTEKRSSWDVIGFTSSGGYWNRNAEVALLDITPKQRLDTIVRKVSKLNFGGTDCSLPFLYAQQQGLDYDSVIVYTDSETWAGDAHPHQRLNNYRKHVGHPVKHIVVGMTANQFSIADPNDADSLDVVGFDTATPNVISQFVKG